MKLNQLKAYREANLKLVLLGSVEFLGEKCTNVILSGSFWESWTKSSATGLDYYQTSFITSATSFSGSQFPAKCSKLTTLNRELW